MNILYYAIGGGTGHFVRGISILRKFNRFKRILITSSKFSHWGEDEGIKVITILPEEYKSYKVRRLILKSKPDLLFIDTFPTGCYGEMVDIDCKKIFIKRTECFYTGFDMVFDLKKIPPVLIRDWDELKERKDLRKKFGIKSGEKVLFFYHNTDKEEVRDWVLRIFELSKKLGLKFFFSSGFKIDLGSLSDLNLSYFPVIEILPMFDIVITGAGYNSYMEVSNLFNSAIFIPFFRKIDNQFERIDDKRFFKALSGNSLKDLILENFERFYFKENPFYENGADYIYERVVNFLN